MKKIVSLVILLLFAACGGDVASSLVELSSGSREGDALIVSSSSNEIIIEFSSSTQILSSATELSSSSVAYSSCEDFLSSSLLEQPFSSSSFLPEESSSSKLNVVFGEMTDERDGQTYKTITIYGMTWMAENLNYAYLQPTAELDSSSWCYDNNPDNCAIYGRLYLWSAVMDSAGLFSPDTKGCGYYAEKEDWYKCPKDSNVRGVCPEHWHVPNSEEFSGPLALTSDKRWHKGDPNRLLFSDGSDGMMPGDGMGFNILCAGFYEGDFIGAEHYAFFWFSNEYDNLSAKDADFPEVSFDMDPRSFWYKNRAFSVRCVKDYEIEDLEI